MLLHVLAFILSVTVNNATASFDALIVGDWGTDDSDQTSVAAAMDAFAATKQSSVILNVGDNFYQGQASYDGIQTANDPKFSSYWKSVYNGPNIVGLPWWSVLGNHDWYTLNSNVYEMEYQDPNWVLSDFFYTKRVQVDTGVFASFIFIETDLLAYGFGGKTSVMGTNFANLGWTSSANSNLKQLAWIENLIAQANNDAFIVVVGHHPTYTCVKDISTDLQTLLGIVNKWNVNAFINGHSHSMAGYITNNGKTMHVQVGSSGQVSSSCDPLDTSYSVQHEDASLGFSHLTITANNLHVDWINSAGSVSFALDVAARTPVNATPDTTNLPSATDAAVHFNNPNAKTATTAATTAVKTTTTSPTTTTSTTTTTTTTSTTAGATSAAVSTSSTSTTSSTTTLTTASTTTTTTTSTTTTTTSTTATTTTAYVDPLCPHDICVTGGPLDWSCSNCVDTVCSYHGHCCNTIWDSKCIGYVNTYCKHKSC